MMIRILVFVDGSSTSNAVNTRAQNVWVDTEHDNDESIFIIELSEPSNAGFISQLQVNQFPSIIFAEVLDANRIKTIARLVGNSSTGQIQDLYTRLLNGERPAVGQGTGTTDVIIKGDDKEGSVGLGLGLFNFKIPRFLWLLLAAGSAYKTFDSTTTLGQVGFGSATAFSIYKYSKDDD